MNCSELILTVSSGKIAARMDDDSEMAPANIAMTPLQRQTISLFEDRLAGEDLTRRELEILGWNLYEVLFPEELERFFDSKYQQTLGQKHCLRVQLSFAEDAGELANLPWEFLYLPPSGNRKPFFFASEVSLVLSRYVTRGGARVPSIQAPKRPINIAVIVSTPASLKLDDQAPVIDALGAPAATPDASGLLFNVSAPKTDISNLDDLESLVRDGDVDVLHFIGYGRYDHRGERGEIALVDPSGEPIWFPNEDFATSLTRHAGSTPKLVFLHLCNTSATWQGLKATFASLARPLVVSGVPVVVAMQYPISPAAAAMFFREFYDRLAKDEPVDVAVQGARYKTAANNPKEYGRLLGTPIFYMQSMNGGLIPPASPAAPDQAETADGPSAVRTSVYAGPSVRDNLLEAIRKDPGATADEKARVQSFLVEVGTDDLAALEQAIRNRFAGDDPPGGDPPAQLRIYMRMLEILSTHRQATSP